jgi:hypothetical protein
LTEPNDSKDYEKKLWDWQMHEDDLLANRANFMLVAESMFFTAFAALTISKSVLPLIIGFSGILLNILWIHMTIIQLNHTTFHLRNEITEFAKKNKNSFLEKYVAICEKRKPFLKITEFIRKWIPLLLIVTWIFLMAFYVLYFFV